MSDLKSCPFCGGKAKKPWFNYDGSGGGSGEVTCSKCSSKVRGQYIPWTEADEKESSVDEAISAWNTRITRDEDGRNPTIELVETGGNDD